MLSLLLQSEMQPLHYAAMFGQVAMVELLIERYNVPADAVAMVCNTHVLLSLIQFVTADTFINQLGSQPIHFAATGGRTEVIELLVNEYKVDPKSLAEVSC